MRLEFDGVIHQLRLWVGPEDFQQKNWFKKKISELRARFDIRPTQEITMLRVEAKSRKIEIPNTRWGWSVPWMKTPLINARSESLLQSRTWAKAIQERRCVIPATAFYEWQRRQDSAKPVPWEIRKTGGDIFYFAALWTIASASKSDSEFAEATIITQPGNKLLQAVHNHGGNAGRQPVFLDEDKLDAWLDPDMKSAEDAVSLLRQIEDGEWEGRPLRQIGNDASHEAPKPLGDGKYVVTDIEGGLINAGKAEKPAGRTTKRKKPTTDSGASLFD